MKLITISIVTAVSVAATSASAGCVAGAQRSLSLCSGVLGMLAMYQGQDHSYFEDEFLELVALPGDLECGYYDNPTGGAPAEWASAMRGAGQIEIEMLMEAEDVTGLQQLLGECVPLYQAWYEE